ncbi:hypothetical protein KY289_001565 [Solanum tuberosum]|nr:hypothetical protein KY289_001565 [Solanum tuberosum]
MDAGNIISQRKSKFVKKLKESMCLVLPPCKSVKQNRRRSCSSLTSSICWKLVLKSDLASILESDPR